MPSHSALVDQIRALEERLLQPSVRASPELLEDLLATGFREFGSSGRVYDRQTTVRGLEQEPQRQITLSDFQAQLLAPGVVLATYRSTQSPGPQGGPQEAWRSSIWMFEDQQWQMHFHQGTPIPLA